MFDSDLVSPLSAALVVALAGVAVTWGVVRLALAWFRLARPRMHGVAERARELLDRESQKARLLRLDAIGPASEPGELTLSAGDDAATWADRLFARCAGGGATLRYDAARGHWSAGVPLFEGGPLVAFVVDERNRRRPFEALMAALEIVVADAPPVVGSEHAPGAVCVRFSDSAGRWQAFQPCGGCGGSWVNAIFDDLDQAPLARLIAQRLVVRDGDGPEHPADPGSTLCRNCTTR